MEKETVRVKVNGESVVRGAKWMIEKRRSGLCTVTVRREASVMSKKGHETLGMQRIGVDEKMVCRESKAFCWGSVQDQGWSFQVRRTMGATMLE